MAVLGSLTAVLLAAAAAATAGETVFGEGSHVALVERVNSAQQGEYERTLAELESHLARHPQDAVASVERCRFFEEFALVEEPTIEGVYESYEKCVEELRAGPHVDAAAVKVYLWTQEWGEESIEAGEAMLDESVTWSLKQRAALHEGLSQRYGEGEAEKGRRHASIALDLDPESSVWLDAAKHHGMAGAASVALAIIEARPASTWSDLYQLVPAAQLLVEIKQVAAARKLVESHLELLDKTPHQRLELARSFTAAGETVLARSLVADLIDGDLPENYGYGLERSVFEFLLAHGSEAEAVAAYRSLRAEGFGADPLGRYRLGLTATHWSAPWAWPDSLGVLALLAILAGLLAVPVLVIAPVHYRSAVKRTHGFLLPPLSPDSPWSLRSLWYAMAVFILCTELPFYFFDYPSFEQSYGWIVAEERFVTQETDFRAHGVAMFWGTLCMPLLLLPLLRGVQWRTILLGRWSALQSIMAGIGVAIVVFFVRGVVATIFDADLVEPGKLDLPYITRAILGLNEAYGLLATLLCVAVITPVVEEFVCRGVMLQSIARHLGFWIAAVLQALLFMAAHEMDSAWIGHFVMAMLAALLVRRGSGLLGPIVLHAVNNFIAVLAMVLVMR